jgi:hypothetical protein
MRSNFKQFFGKKGILRNLGAIFEFGGFTTTENGPSLFGHMLKCGIWLEEVIRVGNALL